MHMMPNNTNEKAITTGILHYLKDCSLLNAGIISKDSIKFWNFLVEILVRENDLDLSNDMKI